MLLNCSVGEDPWQLLGLQGDQTCQSNQSIPKGNQSWIFIGGTDAEDEAPIPWPLDAKNWLIGKDPDAWKDWRQEEKGGNDRRWDGWIASLTPWTWVWASSRSCWWTVKPGVLLSIRLQRVGQDWATELNWIEWILKVYWMNIEWILKVYQTNPKRDWLVWYPCITRDSQESFPASQFKASVLQHSAFFMVQH